MRTRHKLMLARAAYRLMHAMRRAGGIGDTCTVTRGGVRYRLDLAQGIDFAIYVGAFERATAAACRRHVAPGSNVLDIGANIGAHTLNLARLAGPAGIVFAFEPTAYAFRKLRQNLALNPELARGVVAIQGFVGPDDKDRLPDEIPSAWPLTPAARLHATHQGEDKSTAGAEALSIDGFLARRGNPAIRFVKLDVDGFECDVLSGARSMMERDRPVFAMEIAPYALAERGASLARLLGYFAPLGYRLFDEKSERALPGSADDLERLVGDGASINVIARCP